MSKAADARKGTKVGREGGERFEASILHREAGTGGETRLGRCWIEEFLQEWKETAWKMFGGGWNSREDRKCGVDVLPWQPLRGTADRE